MDNDLVKRLVWAGPARRPRRPRQHRHHAGRRCHLAARVRGGPAGVSDETQSTSEAAAVLPEVEGHPTGAERAYDRGALEQPGFAEQHPEALVGAAFVGGIVLAQLIEAPWRLIPRQRQRRARRRGLGGLRARVRARPRGDRARQGRGLREGHQARPRRGGRHRRRHLRGRRPALPAPRAAWGLYTAFFDEVYLGYLMVAGVLFLLAALAGWLAAAGFKGGSPPTPKMAIEEAKLIKETSPRRARRPRPSAPTRTASARSACADADRRAQRRGDPRLDRAQPPRARASRSGTSSSRSTAPPTGAPSCARTARRRSPARRSRAS